MDQTFDLRSLRRVASLAPFTLGAAVALLVAVLPQWRLESVVAASALDQLFAAARPPLGATARSALALLAGVLVAGSGWMVLRSLAKRSPERDPELATDVPVLRRADAHPDAPARRPLFASADLGQPLPIGAVEAPAIVPDEGVGDPVGARTLPADLDTPMASVDPAAIPAVPMEPVRAVAPLARPAVIEETDRFETFELTPIRRAAPSARASVATPPAASAGSTSLSALLDRLEQSSARRAIRPDVSIEETLGMLRGLAAR